jgi:hypothetical protein
VAIYSDLLAVAFEDTHQQGDVAVLTRAAIMSRIAVNRTRSGQGMVAEYLAAQLAYDRALIRLCLASGIATSPARFERPAIERQRLEDALAGIGVVLDTASNGTEGTSSGAG